MFGYVRAEASELRVREHEYYKGTYCGLCRAMGSCTGQCSRMTLSYDFAFLALLRFAFVGERTSFSQKRCIAHPLKKRNVMNGNRELDFCAYASSILTYHKVRDDIADGGFWRRLAIRLFVLPSASRMRRRTLRRASECRELDEKCAELLTKLSELEKQRCGSVDLPASIFGELLGEFLAFSLEGNTKKIACNAGRSIGRWIYIADALDDIDDDLKTKNYNPFVEIYKNERPTREQAEDIAAAMKNELFEAQCALDLLDFGEDETIKNIIFNILYLGMPERIEKIVLKFGEPNRKDNGDE